MYQKVASFSFLDPPKTDTNNFSGGYKKIFLDPPHEKLLVDISYNIPVPVNRYFV